MVREFEEEAGVLTAPDTWQHFVTLRGEGFEIFFYHASSRQIDAVHTVEDEEVGIYPVDTLPDTVLHNLRWLIPMALDEKVDFAEAIEVMEG